jgi:hypothetical protein
MRSSKPTSVLVFLGSCLFFAEALAGVAKAVDKELSGVWVLIFGTVNLGVVVGALLFMFWYKPEFLTAERGDVVQLRAIEAIIAQNDVKLVRELIKNMDWKRVVSGTKLPEVDSGESSASSERVEVERFDATIEQGKPGGNQ